jgi:hypothetical protein
MTPEGRVKSAVDKVITGAGAYKHKPVGNGMGAPALDYHVCHRGIYAGIETKARDKKPTPRQIRTMKDMAAAGGALFLIDSDDGKDFAQFVGWLLNPIPGFVSNLAVRALNSKEFVDGNAFDD